MRSIVEGIYNLLLEQKNALETLNELSQEKRRAIIKGDAEGIDGFVRREMREVSKINAAEKKRMALTPEISRELGLPEKDITVSAIIERADAEEREKLSRLQKELSGLLHRQSEFNAENQELIRAHLEYSDAMLGLMVDAEDPLNNFYGGDGKAADDRKKTTGFFDGQI